MENKKNQVLCDLPLSLSVLQGQKSWVNCTKLLPRREKGHDGLIRQAAQEWTGLPAQTGKGVHPPATSDPPQQGNHQHRSIPRHPCFSHQMPHRKGPSDVESETVSLTETLRLTHRPHCIPCADWKVSGQNWGQEEKRATEGEVVVWHCSLNEHEFEQILRQWKTGKFGLLQFIWLQRVGHKLLTEQQQQHTRHYTRCLLHIEQSEKFHELNINIIITFKNKYCIF